MGQHVLAVLLLGIASLGSGLPLAAFVGKALALPYSARAALVPLLGLVYIGVLTLAIGHVGLLGPWLPYGLAIFALVCLSVSWRSSRHLAARILRGANQQFRHYPISMGAVSVGLSVAIVAAFAPPSRVDEIEYHWPAALEWADAGRWLDSSFRHVDGFPFMEVVYTAAATHGSYVAAHLLHLSMLLALGGAAAAVGRSLGLRGAGPIAAGAMAAPVVWDQAYVAYNDTAVGAFAVAAVAVAATGRGRYAPFAWSGFLISIAVSIKPSAVAVVGVVALMHLLQQLFSRRPDAPRWWVEWLVRAAIVTVPAVATLVFWTLRQWIYTGHVIDPVASAPPDDYALTMLPTATEQALAPLLPFVSGIIGAVEPWGGRTAVVVQVLLIPAIIYVLVRRGSVLRRFATVAVPAWAHWIVLGFAIVRTRFHIVTWALLVVSVRVVLEDAQDRYPRLAPWMELLWGLLIVIGVGDVSVDMARTISQAWG